MPGRYSMESQNIRPTKGKAVELARQGGFTGTPTFLASRSVRKAFGEGLVRGWLRSLGNDVKDESLLIRADDYGLEVFPSLKRFRRIDVITSNEKLAVEVKTYGSHSLQSSGDTLEEQLADFLRWRRSSRGRQLILAVVHYFGEPVVSRPDLRFIRANRIPIMRFIIRGMQAKYDAHRM